MKNDNDLLADMSVWNTFFRLAIPAVAAQLINILYNLVDKMFIGRIPGAGKHALAGVGVTAPVILAISAFVPNAVMGVYLAEPIADTIAVCTTAPMFCSYYRKLKC